MSSKMVPNGTVPNVLIVLLNNISTFVALFIRVIN